MFHAARESAPLYVERAEDHVVDEPLLAHALAGRNKSGLQYDEIRWTPGMYGSTMLRIGRRPAKSKFQFVRKEGSVIWIRFEDGYLFPLPRIPMSGEIDGLACRRIQYPVRFPSVCAADMAQGRTMKLVVLGSTKYFGHGRLYVACSRVTKRENLYRLVTTEQNTNPPIQGEQNANLLIPTMN